MAFRRALRAGGCRYATREIIFDLPQGTIALRPTPSVSSDALFRYRLLDLRLRGFDGVANDG